MTTDYQCVSGVKISFCLTPRPLNFTLKEVLYNVKGMSFKKVRLHHFYELGC